MLMVCLLSGSVFLLVSFSTGDTPVNGENLRQLYAKPPAEWPAPHVQQGVSWSELGAVPPHPLAGKTDSLAALIELGKVLFFDTRLSESGKISCASCHDPALNWTDSKARSTGHEGAITARNAPTIQNSWFYKKLFWDGRARNLADQAFAPIVSESEMHSEMPLVMQKLRRSEYYPRQFEKAFGSKGIDPDRMTEAIAAFEKTVSSAPSRFDAFLSGDKYALTNAELRGLHLFRTKAGCINCHNGPLLTDNLFHNSGFSGNDAGLYKVTHNEEDRGKIKTPSLRDVARTGPWMHDGAEKELAAIIEKYNQAAFPAGTDPLLKPLGLSARDRKDLLQFLRAVSAPPLPFTKPAQPR